MYMPGDRLAHPESNVSKVAMATFDQLLVFLYISAHFDFRLHGKAMPDFGIRLVVCVRLGLTAEEKNEKRGNPS
jgi:hypothetical protein